MVRFVLSLVVAAGLLAGMAAPSQAQCLSCHRNHPVAKVIAKTAVTTVRLTKGAVKSVVCPTVKAVKAVKQHHCHACHGHKIGVVRKTVRATALVVDATLHTARMAVLKTRCAFRRAVVTPLGRLVTGDCTICAR